MRVEDLLEQLGFDVANGEESAVPRVAPRRIELGERVKSWLSRLRTSKRKRSLDAGAIHVHLTDKHVVRALGDVVRISLFSGKPPDVFGCLECGTLWAEKPVDGCCPKCRADGRALLLVTRPIRNLPT